MSLPDFALSVREPWCWAILNPVIHKDIENRSWPTKFCGRVLLHAGKRYDPEGALWMRSQGIIAPGPDALVLGAYVGIVTITCCWRYQDASPANRSRLFATGPYCFELKEALPLPAARKGPGRLGIYRWRDMPKEGEKEVR